MCSFAILLSTTTIFLVGGQSAKPPAPVEEGKGGYAKIQPLTAKEQEQLLGARLTTDSPLGVTSNDQSETQFSQFANMFLASSRLQIGQGITLATSSTEIAKATLQFPFPSFYKPTLREILDTIALQTHSQWTYDPSSKYFQSDVKHEKPVQGLAIFEFTKSKRVKPFEVTLAMGWKAVDKRNWLMLVPPSFPVGMDIYEMGTYSTDEKTKRADFLKKVQREVALEWSQRVSKDAGPEKLKSVKVGIYDALFFEAMIPSQREKEVRWRQWVFMVDNKCYFVVSTIFPEFEKKIFPDVEKMLASFKTKQ